MRTEEISKEALERIMSILAAGDRNAADKFKECLGVIDSECRDIRVYSWITMENGLVPVYPGTEMADFDMLREIADGFVRSGLNSLGNDGQSDICGRKYDNGEDGGATIVLIEKKRKGMLPAGLANPYHDVDNVFTEIGKICNILRPERQFEEFKARANIMDLPDKIHFIENMADGLLYPMFGIVSVMNAGAVLDAGGYIYTSQLIREWVAKVKEIAGERAEMYYCSDASFIVACVGTRDEGMNILQQLPELLSSIKMVRFDGERLVSLSAKASVVAVPVMEEYYENPSRTLRKAMRFMGMKRSFFVIEDRHIAEADRQEEVSEPAEGVADDAVKVAEIFAQMTGAD